MELFGAEIDWRRLIRHIARVTRHAEAEDLAHVAVVRTLERGSGDIANPEAFLVKAAVNQAWDEHRRAQHPAAPVPFDPATFFLRDPAPLPDEALEAHERLARVRAGLKELSPRTREVFLMHRFDGLKYVEIAEKLSISVSAVEKHIARAMQFLAEWTKDY
ncbi:MAG TPA: sigma-70 family RNA polymerase sigma factor [Steroidobacter sp.]|uniref:RNA polymerase sigma factor n=1 Tax=Steroidobacter sp. TaxID=1978227 RepID=UPI002EDA6AC9